MKKNITFNECKSYEDIEAVCLAALEYDELVDDRKGAEQWFKDAEMEGDVISRDVVNTQVSIWYINEEMNGEVLYSVRIYEHYIDPGSVDYVYSYEINAL